MQHRITLVVFTFSILLGCFFEPAWALEPIVLTTDKEVYNVSKHLELFEDPDRKMTINQVSHPLNSKKFKRNTQEVLNFGLNYSNHWGRFSLKNSSAKEINLLFEFGHPAIESLSIFKPQLDKGFLETKSGRKIPFTQREIKHRNYVFKIQVPAQTAQTYYFKMHSSASISPSLTLMSERAFSQYDHEAQLGFGFYFGLGQAGEQTPEIRLAIPHKSTGSRDGSRANADQDLIGFWRRFAQGGDLQHFGTAILIYDYCFHSFNFCDETKMQVRVARIVRVYKSEPF